MIDFSDYVFKMKLNIAVKMFDYYSIDLLITIKGCAIYNFLFHLRISELTGSEMWHAYMDCQFVNWVVSFSENWFHWRWIIPTCSLSSYSWKRIVSESVRKRFNHFDYAPLATIELGFYTLIWTSTHRKSNDPNYWSR